MVLGGGNGTRLKFYLCRKEPQVTKALLTIFRLILQNDMKLSVLYNWISDAQS